MSGTEILLSPPIKAVTGPERRQGTAQQAIFLAPDCGVEEGRGGEEDLPPAIRQSLCQAHGGRGRFIAGRALPAEFPKTSSRE